MATQAVSLQRSRGQGRSARGMQHARKRVAHGVARRAQARRRAAAATAAYAWRHARNRVRPVAVARGNRVRHVAVARGGESTWLSALHAPRGARFSPLPCAEDHVHPFPQQRGSEQPALPRSCPVRAAPRPQGGRLDSAAPRSASTARPRPAGPTSSLAWPSDVRRWREEEEETRALRRWSTSGLEWPSDARRGRAERETRARRRAVARGEELRRLEIEGNLRARERAARTGAAVAAPWNSRRGRARAWLQTTSLATRGLEPLGLALLVLAGVAGVGVAAAGVAARACGPLEAATVGCATALLVAVAGLLASACASVVAAGVLCVCLFVADKWDEHTHWSQYVRSLAQGIPRRD